MKYRIFLHNVVLPVIVAIGFFLFWKRIADTFWIFWGVVATIGILARVLLNDRKYILNFSITTTHLQVDYATAFLVTRSLRFPLSEIRDIELTRANWVAEYPAALNIKIAGKWWEYQILGRGMSKVIEAELTAHNLIGQAKHPPTADL